ncbi:MAG: hypothetical protein CME80_13020 [Halomonas sp.]|nr:hypothetical protein [Halomonas sp.]MBF58610.1 hypothetical protein [Halomonas sp.]|tara:strand:- start:544 stop:918 length:375 start_codon:yes stop_codon:yes gene_type:complete
MFVHRNLRQHLGYLVLLLMVVQGLVVTGFGESLAHGAGVSAVAVHFHEHSICGNHLTLSNNVEERAGEFSASHHESGSHFHESTDRLATELLHESILVNSLRVGYQDGMPLRRIFRLERPPRPV